jgi:hypothetical protein
MQTIKPAAKKKAPAWGRGKNAQRGDNAFLKAGSVPGRFSMIFFQSTGKNPYGMHLR